ncbi:MAG: ATP-binding protein [Lachnospiraceae bacterium]|nr:ATP-binding protein [Lachnospiraceae bacterium]
MRTVVAYANLNGGKLIFGVENNTWEVIGFTKEEGKLGQALRASPHPSAGTAWTSSLYLHWTEKSSRMDLAKMQIMRV